MDALLQDFRHSVRRLLRAPGFSLLAVLTLALGIGANTAIFSLVNALLLKPAPGVRAADRIVTLFTSDYSSSLYSASSYPDYEAVRRETAVFSDVAALTTSPVNVARAEQLERLNAEVVTPNYFTLLGVRTSAGRLFSEADVKADAPALVLSEDAWRSRYGADPGVIGSTVQVNGQPFTVIGVAASRFNGLSTGMRIDAWLPLPHALQLVGASLSSRDSRGLAVFARLAPGVSVEAAQARMRVLQQSLFATYPEAWRNLAGESRTLTVMTERDARVPPDNRGQVFTLAGVLLAAVAVVLLICCANVANLLLARGAAREREIVIRYSLGARRWIVLRQLLIESVLLAAGGGVVGIFVAVWTTDLLLARDGALPVFFDVSPDVRVFAYTVLVSIVTAALFGLVPALRSTRARAALVLKTERTLSATGRMSLRDVLVGAQIALALVLSISAALLARTLQNARHVDVGMDVNRMVIAALDLQTRGYNEPRADAFYRQLHDRLEALPEVEAVTYAQRVPIANASGRRSVEVVGYAPQAGEDMEFPFNVVTADYFATMRLPIVQGRAFTDADHTNAPGAIVVNETFARRFWPNEDPIGKQVRVGSRAPLTVVGVARDGKYWSITEQPRPYYYLSAEQNQSGLQLHVRARSSEAQVQKLVRQVIRELDPQLPILTLGTMEGRMVEALTSQRVAGGLIGVSALLAVLLAAVGVYGVTSVLVVQRVPEIGLRVALGASTGDVLRLIVGRASIVAAAGIGSGAILATLGTRAVESMLFGISRFDPLSFAVAAVTLAGAAVLAAYVPARRAARVQPLVALTR